MIIIDDDYEDDKIFQIHQEEFSSIGIVTDWEESNSVLSLTGEDGTGEAGEIMAGFTCSSGGDGIGVAAVMMAAGVWGVAARRVVDSVGWWSSTSSLTRIDDSSIGNRIQDDEVDEEVGMVGDNDIDEKNDGLLEFGWWCWRCGWWYL